MYMINRFLTQIVAKLYYLQSLLILTHCKNYKCNFFDRTFQFLYYISKGINNFFLIWFDQPSQLYNKSEICLHKTSTTYLGESALQFFLDQMYVGDKYCWSQVLVLLRKQFHHPSGIFTKQAAAVNFSEQITVCIVRKHKRKAKPKLK